MKEWNCGNLAVELTEAQMRRQRRRRRRHYEHHARDLNMGFGVAELLMKLLPVVVMIVVAVFVFPMLFETMQKALAREESKSCLGCPLEEWMGYAWACAVCDLAGYKGEAKKNWVCPKHGCVPSHQVGVRVEGKRQVHRCKICNSRVEWA